jgi:hypothetical protein
MTISFNFDINTKSNMRQSRLTPSYMSRECNVFVPLVLVLYVAATSVIIADAANVPLELDNKKVLDVKGDSNVNSGWIDSYSVGDNCYCASTFDHDIGIIVVSTPYGMKTVKEVCDMINVNAPPNINRPTYNDVQCGNGPDNGLEDEKICPGRTDHGQNGCKYIGPKWNFSVLNSTTPVAQPITPVSAPVPQPIMIPPQPQPQPQPAAVVPSPISVTVSTPVATKPVSIVKPTKAAKPVKVTKVMQMKNKV